ncbi:MAG: hypothetical protein CMJ74_10055 [Planctomycetaceae bacterium]|nr:hypothetical protein [Planctomycetaceae bacterium]|tara:strand:+ start:4054 stop:4374 length:321 start_codon:yes stop_codon:yes gene_type:complete
MTDAQKMDTEDHPPYAPEIDMPRRPLGQSSKSERKRQGKLSNGLAVLFAVLGLGSLAVLIVGCSGGNPVILLLVLALGGFLFLHYIIWGRLLNRTADQDDRVSVDD